MGRIVKRGRRGRGEKEKGKEGQEMEGNEKGGKGKGEREERETERVGRSGRIASLARDSSPQLEGRLGTLGKNNNCVSDLSGLLTIQPLCPVAPWPFVLVTAPPWSQRER